MWDGGAVKRVARRPGTLRALLLAVASLLLLFKVCSFLYFAGVKAGTEQALSTSTSLTINWNESGEKSATAAAQRWREVWGTHGEVLRKVMRVKTLLNNQRQLYKPAPEKENQDMAGVEMLLAQALLEMQEATRVGEIQKWVKREVTEGLERVFEKLQFPEDCERAPKLVCELDKGCGFGCQVHHAVHCFANAVALNRTMLLKVVPWRYAPTGHWDDVFLPVTHCPFPTGERTSWGPQVVGNETHPESPSVFIDIIDYAQTIYDPPAMPFDIQEAVRLFHTRPEVWWVAALTKFLLRPSAASVARQAGLVVSKREGEQTSLSGGIPPFVGVHIRRSDKVTALEAQMYEVAAYMRHVEQFCDRKLPSGWQLAARNSPSPCAIYLATEETTVLREVMDNYPHIRLVGNNNLTALEAKVSLRNSFEGLLGIYDDVIYLSRADYLVGTLSSQVSRLAYEIMQHREDIVDASFSYQSLDSVWYYGGQPPCRYCVASDFTASGQQVLIKGDELECDVIVQVTGGTVECFSNRLGEKVWVPTGLVDWCPQPVDGLPFRNVLPSYMSREH